MPDNTVHRGFTLLELAIVLIIISLIAGGIFIGKDLKQNAELLSLIQDIQTYKSAVRNYYDKYGQLPGDDSNAATNVGAAHSGNGNNLVGDYVFPASPEGVYLFEHLTKAKLIDKVFNGELTGGSPSTYATTGVNVPAVYNKSALMIENVDQSWAGDTNWFPNLQYGLVLYIGGPNAAPTLTGNAAYLIDKKLDDSFPGTGKIVTYKRGAISNTINCATSTNPNAVYDTTSSVINCALNIRDILNN